MEDSSAPEAMSWKQITLISCGSFALLFIVGVLIVVKVRKSALTSSFSFLLDQLKRTAFKLINPFADASLLTVHLSGKIACDIGIKALPRVLFRPLHARLSPTYFGDNLGHGWLSAPARPGFVGFLRGGNAPVLPASDDAGLADQNYICRYALAFCF